MIQTATRYLLMAAFCSLGCAHQVRAQAGSRQTEAPLSTPPIETAPVCKGTQGGRCPTAKESSATEHCQGTACQLALQCAASCGAELGKKLADYVSTANVTVLPVRREACHSEGPECYKAAERLLARDLVERTHHLEACLHGCLAPDQQIGEEETQCDARTTTRYACNDTNACRASQGCHVSRFDGPNHQHANFCQSRVHRIGKGCVVRRNGRDVEGTCVQGDCVTEEERAEACWRAAAYAITLDLADYSEPPNTGIPDVGVDEPALIRGHQKRIREVVRHALRCTLGLPDEPWDTTIRARWDGSMAPAARMPEP